MTDYNQQIEANEENLNSSSFIQKLMQYYSEFLATDFKKGYLPKRRFETKDKKGRTSGISLEKYPELLSYLYKKIDVQFKNQTPLKIKHQKYTSKLAPIVRTAIDKSIKTIGHVELVEAVNVQIENFKVAVNKKDADHELELEKLKNGIELSLEHKVVSQIIENLEPVFERSAANVIDTLITSQDTIIEQILGDVDEALSSALFDYFHSNQEEAIYDCIFEYLKKDRLEFKLTEYFDGFATSDFFSELRNITFLEQLDENLEYYLYFGEIRFKNHNFPIFFMPLNVSLDGNEISISFEPRLLINKKAVDYVSRSLQERSGSKSVSVVDTRIQYIEEEEKLTDVLDKLLQPIIGAFQFDGSFTFSPEKRSLKDANASITNSLNLSLFDKSDESMLTDYEELIDRLSVNGENLIQIVNDLVNDFLSENPANINEDIEDWWDGTSVSDRLVFETPIPLAEEQRKILEALNHGSGRFVSVEGPPGTGKSHTISAIAFSAILKGQSILILSDTKEALDVVENKLNQTLSKVRPSDDFVNPILRLGRTGSNFNKVTQNKSIDSLRVQNRALNKTAEREKRIEQYGFAVKNLKKGIDTRIKVASSVNLKEVFEYENEWADFANKWAEELDFFIEIFENEKGEFTEHNAAIKSLVNLREECSILGHDVVNISKGFGDDLSALSTAITFISSVNDKSTQTKIFQVAPKMSAKKIPFLETKYREIRDAKGFFGYLFSGSQLRSAKDDLYRHVGYSTDTLGGDALLQEISALINKADEFFDEIENKFPNTSSLIPEAIKYLDQEVSLSAFKELSKKINQLQNLSDQNLIPFLEDETLLEILTNDESIDAAFFEYFLELQEKRVEITEIFSDWEFNYLARKTEIENYNALILASTIDERVIKFADNYRNDAKTLAKIIRQKKKFPRDKFDLLKTAFPCMICSLRDYAEYIPLENELFDIIIIDEASQVSIAQAFPAIIRAKKMIVMGDKMQFGNVKTANASKELNSAYFNKVKETLEEELGGITTDLQVRADQLNVTNSVLDFMDNMTNFPTRLKKHFRGYPEMISLSSKYFYGGGLQAMKIRGKPIDDVLEFLRIEHDGLLDITKNTNELEAMAILQRVEAQYQSGDHRSVAVITPFTEQQTLVSKVFSEHQHYSDFLKILKFKSFTFDTCQGEERDIIYYSFVATDEKDRLSHILPKSLIQQNEEELDRNKRMQRINVAFSRGKEKLVFVHSKDINKLTAGSDVLNHYLSELQSAKDIPTEDDLDQNSEAEKKVLKWIQQTEIYNKYKPEIKPQFEIGKYLKFLDEEYNHPAYRVDFLLTFIVDSKQRDIIIEYDGFEYHFNNPSNVDAHNWRYYQKEGDIEREYILESYGYKTLRINRYNTGNDPVNTLNSRIEKIIEAFSDRGDALTKKVVEETLEAQRGLSDGSFKTCRKCGEDKPFSEFMDTSTARGYRNNCKLCSHKR